MMSADETRPTAGSGELNGKAGRSGKKSDKRRRRPGQTPEPIPVPVQEALPEVPDPLPEAAPPAESPEPQDESSAVLAIATAALPGEPATPAPSTSVGVQTITDAYGDYTRKSIAQTSSFFAQLADTRSLGRMLELQSEFARTAFEMFVDDSRKIRELYRELAKQRLQSFEGYIGGRKTD